MLEERQENSVKSWIALLLFLVSSFGTGFLGSFATARGLPFWYQTLTKPSWNPPNWLFGPVWTLLYLLMGIAAWQIWSASRTEGHGLRTSALALYFCQLLLNALWSWLFFGWQLVAVAFWEIVLLELAIVAMTWLFFKIRPRAGWMLVPYLLWVLFAASLNFAIWRLNAPH
jgi:tryptophan-rich sensory protein